VAARSSGSSAESDGGGVVSTSTAARAAAALAAAEFGAEETPSQTAGPYVHIGLMPTYAGNANYYQEEIGVSPISGDARGEIIEIVGSVYDGTGWALRRSALRVPHPNGT